MEIYYIDPIPFKDFNENEDFACQESLIFNILLRKIVLNKLNITNSDHIDLFFRPYHIYELSWKQGFLLYNFWCIIKKMNEWLI